MPNRSLRFRVWLTLTAIAGMPAFAAAADRYEGKYCTGAGDVEFLRLIDESFAFFHPNPIVPNVAMLYRPDWDAFEEGAGWGAWWCSNSHGFVYCSPPFLPEPFFGVLERTNKLWYDGQGDGKTGDFYSTRADYRKYPTVAPEGVLPECASPGGIRGCQHIVGEGNVTKADWAMTSTAAEIMLQAELLLVKRDMATIREYLPKMEKAAAFLESRRDPKNGLLLAGPCATMQGADYTGYRKPDGTFGKAYLAVLAVNYCAALERMVEVYHLTGDAAKQKEFTKRWEASRKSLSRLLTPEGYFVNYIAPDGMRHGVIGQKLFGYFGSLANVDAAALRVVDTAAAEKIYQQIAAMPELRPFDFVLTNYPGLDDTHWNWGNRTIVCSSAMGFGDWVNGGVWGSAEGRAILMYYRLGKFEDVRRSAARAMKWAKDFRMDAPWSQRGENTYNLWSDAGGSGHQVNGVAVMVDNFAIPAATVRGLFDYEYRADRLILRPRVPGSITEYVQKHPVRFGEKRLYISCHNGGPRIKSVAVNGKTMRTESPDAIALLYDELPKEAKIEIVAEGGWGTDSAKPAAPSSASKQIPEAAALRNELPESLKRPYAVLTTMDRLLAEESNAEYERAFVRESLGAIASCRQRMAVDPGPGCFRPNTPTKREAIFKFYANTARRMYNGLAKRLTDYAKSSQVEKQHLAEVFQRAQGKRTGSGK